VAFTDRGTATIGTSFKLVTCNSLGLGLDENADCLICNEGQYCQPYIDSDRFSYQIVSNHYNEPKRIEFYDLEANIIFYTSDYYEFSWCKKDNVYTINISLNMGAVIDAQPLINFDCFFVKLVFDDLFVVEEVEVNTQPYCKVKCEELSIVIESTYNSYDCNGIRYKSVADCDDSDGTLLYSNQMRLKGNFYYNSYSMDTTVSDRFNSLVKRSEDFYLFECYDQLPEWVVRKFKSCIMGQDVRVLFYKGDTLIKDYQNLIIRKGTEKNNDSGVKWTLKQEFSKICEVNNIC
jgi:hypothetical protein